MFDEPFDGELLTYYLNKLSEGYPDSVKYRKEIFRTFIKAVHLWDNHIEIEFNFTATDGNGNPYKVVKTSWTTKRKSLALFVQTLP